MAFERIVPGTVEWDLYSGNHKSRYFFAKEIVERNKCLRILDAATGVGYGAGVLSETGANIVAVDRSEEALKIAQTQFSNNKITYVKDDCEILGQIKESFDAVVSFETLEHLKRPESFLKRCNELLSDNGLLILSTPNQLVSGHTTKKDWEYHEKEYNPEELINMVFNAGFKKVELYGQYYSQTGLLRNQFRSELNRIHSNPFLRLGRWIQKILRGVQKRAVLPEMLSDFEIKEFQIEDSKTAMEQPFVLIAIARK